jgi:hypothetical protein
MLYQGEKSLRIYDVADGGSQTFPLAVDGTIAKTHVLPDGRVVGVVRRGESVDLIQLYGPR